MFLTKICKSPKAGSHFTRRSNSSSFRIASDQIRPKNYRKPLVVGSLFKKIQQSFCFGHFFWSSNHRRQKCQKPIAFFKLFAQICKLLRACSQFTWRSNSSSFRIASDQNRPKTTETHGFWFCIQNHSTIY